MSPCLWARLQLSPFFSWICHILSYSEWFLLQKKTKKSSQEVWTVVICMALLVYHFGFIGHYSMTIPLTYTKLWNEECVWDKLVWGVTFATLLGTELLLSLWDFIGTLLWCSVSSLILKNPFFFISVSGESVPKICSYIFLKFLGYPIWFPWEKMVP